MKNAGTTEGKRAREPQEDPAADDQVRWGPSGGGNRETQGRRWKPFMNGRERQGAFDTSPYSRQFIDAWKDERSTHLKSALTEFDSEVLLQDYIKQACPRNLFQGKVFFLNSCDSDPLVSVYLLEKIIRFLGGLTSMSVSGAVAYVVTHHLCSAKEIKHEGSLRSRGRGAGTKWVHPHFILECARQGTLVSDVPYLLSESRSSLNAGSVADKTKPSVREPTVVVLVED